MFVQKQLQLFQNSYLSQPYVTVVYTVIIPIPIKAMHRSFGYNVIMLTSD